MQIRRLLPALVLLSLLGCTLPGGIALPPFPIPGAPAVPETLLPAQVVTVLPVTDTPLPESSFTPGADQTPTEAGTPTAVPLTIPATYFDFPTITPSPTLDVSEVALRIVSPGPMSKVTSPIDFLVHVEPDYTGLTRIELLGEDGRELYRKVFKTHSNIGYFTRVDEKINFEIKGAAEVARLQISTFDEFGRMQAFNSVRLLLLSVGENEFSPPYAPKERVALRYPQKGTEISGGVLPVMAEFLPVNDTPLILELFDTDGVIIGSRLLQLAPADGSYQKFTTTVPYQVSSKTVARLVFRQSDDRISGLAYLYSIKLIISP
jgi:hypothetical protein